ncbi:hypothetical protein WI84_28015 [Burkholderia ubonensis]|uniref:hypothetical protein n=1 Tax=Burkholderia ubonensis TaxID=101571 RepID=UPI00075EB03F|nr:hypothetical protein [Burkholderia ubonensis]KVD28733.1 hypothetical protein WI84_28015 [Burkholderia ubonensis]
MTLLKNLLDKWKAQSISGKLYTSGNAALMLVMGVLMTIPWTAQRALTLFMAVPLLLFMAGFLIWFVPKLLAFGRSQIGTMPIVVVSTLLAPICLGLARQFVGAVVQLPPQSFDVTVALFVVLFIPIGCRCRRHPVVCVCRFETGRGNDFIFSSTSEDLCSEPGWLRTRSTSPIRTFTRASNPGSAFACSTTALSRMRSGTGLM